MLRFSANLSMLFTEVPLLERFAKAHGAGFAAVEIQFPYEASIDDLLAAKQQAMVEVVLINLPAADLMSGGEGLACVPTLEGEFRVAVTQGIDYAKALGVPCVNVLAGRCLHGSPEDYLQTFETNLRFAADTCGAHGIRVVTEAINNRDMPGFLINTDQHMLNVLARLNHPNIAMQVDVYHMAMMGCDVFGLVSEHAERIGHIQFADCPGRGEPGTGELPFDEIFGAIDSSGYQGWVGAEYRPSTPTSDHLNWFS